MGRGRLRRARLRSGVVTWWAALSSGRFFTAWSFVVGVPLAVVILAPYDADSDAASIFAAQGAALTAAVPFVIALLPIAWAERRIASPRVRGGVVVGALIAVSVARPFVNEAIAVAGFGLDADGRWVGRVLTNLVAWFAVLSLVAISEQLYSSSRDAMLRLADAVRSISDAQRRAGRYERESRDFLGLEVGILRAALADLLRMRLDFDRVRAFSDRVRAVSHRAQDRARLDLTDLLPDALVSTADAPAHRRVLERLRPPPALLVGSVFAGASAPFAFYAGGSVLALIAVPGIFVVGAATDLLTRRIGLRQRAADRGAVVLAGWVTAGGFIAVAAVALLDEAGIVTLIPVVAVPGLALAAAFAADAIHRARVETRRLGRALRLVARSAALSSAGARQSLVRAADILHGRVQGTCVILAAQVDDRVASADDIRSFERSVSAAFDEVLGGGAVASAPTLRETVAVWRPVVAVDSAVDDDAADALRDPLVSFRVVAVVAEGLVNAVKHSAARTAAVDVASDAREGTVRVTVSSPGELRPGHLDSGHGIAGLGASARLYQRGSDVVLEATVRVGLSVEPDVAVPLRQPVGALHDSDSM